jgi:hypothetical protein
MFAKISAKQLMPSRFNAVDNQARHCVCFESICELEKQSKLSTYLAFVLT